MVDIFEIYKKELSKKKYQILSEKEKQNLLKKIKEEGCQDSREKLVNSLQRFVYSTAIKYNEDGVGHLDLIQGGNIGLLNAIGRYDSKKDFQFLTYGKHRIMGGMKEVKRYERRKGFNSIGRKINPLMISIQEIQDNKKFKKYGLSSHIIEKALNSRGKDTKKEIIDKDFKEKFDCLLEKIIEKKRIGEHEKKSKMNREIIKLVLERMRNGEKTKRNNNSLNFKEIGEIYGVTESIVSQISTKFIKRLRKNPELKEIYKSLN